MKKLLFLIALFFTAAASAQVIKPDLTRSPNGPNTIVDWNVKFKTMIIPHGNTFTLAGAQDSTGHLRLRVAGDTSVAVYIKGFGWLPFANKRDINSATAFGYGLNLIGHTLSVDTAGVHDIVSKDRLATNLTGYLKKTDSSEYITPWQFYHGNNITTGNWTFNGVNTSFNSIAYFNSQALFSGYTEFNSSILQFNTELDINSAVPINFNTGSDQSLINYAPGGGLKIRTQTSGGNWITTFKDNSITDSTGVRYAKITDISSDSTYNEATYFRKDSAVIKQDTLGTNGPVSLVYGALRPIYDTVSHTNTWSFVNDALHKPSSAITSVTSTSTYVQVNYSTYARIHLGMITNDESMAKAGVFAGSSIGNTNTKIFIYQQLNDYVIATYSASTSSWTFTGTNTAGTSMAFSGTLHYLTFTNTAWPQSQNVAVRIESSDTDLTHDTNKYIAADVAYPSTTSIRFRLLKLTGDYLPALVDGLQLKFTFSGIVQVNPTTYAFANLPNFWFYGIFGR